MDTTSEPRIRAWDPMVRLTHWGIALAILLNGLVTEEGSDWHIMVGTAAASLLGVRLLWGLIGPAPARFSAFPPSPARAIAHVGDIMAGRHRPHRSHNPLGALMAYALWATMAVVIATGLSMAGLPGTGRAPAATSPLAEAAASAEHEAHESDVGEGDNEGEEAAEGGDAEGWLEELHEAAANLLFLLSALHVAGVVFETRRSGAQVIARMTVGRDG